MGINLFSKKIELWIIHATVFSEKNFSFVYIGWRRDAFFSLLEKAERWKEVQNSACATSWKIKSD